MDALLFHPKLVHVPIALAVLMPLVAGSLALAWWKTWLPRRVWWVAVALQAILVVSGLAALKSGEADEGRVERLVAESLIEAHEARAHAFVIAGATVLVAMAAAALLESNRAAMRAAALSTLGTLLVLQLGYQTGQAGGELVYTHGAAQAYTATKTTSSPSRRSVAAATNDDEDEIENENDD